MQCGAAVIGSNLSSIPEVIGREDALFDPYDRSQIARMLHKSLTQEDFRQSLCQHGLQQSSKFTWQESARRAWVAIESQTLAATPIKQCLTAKFSPNQLPLLAFVSPLPPERTGIADYASELLPELARHYEITVITDQYVSTDPWIEANCERKDVEWFRANAASFDRILYQFGNSPFHQHMFDLLEQHPGVVVLHDFFLGHVIRHIDFANLNHGLLARSIYRSHGYPGLECRFKDVDAAEAIQKRPMNFDVIRNALGVISHSKYSQKLAESYYSEDVTAKWAVIPLLRAIQPKTDRIKAKEALGFGENDFLFCSFGLIDEPKQPDSILRAWAESATLQAAQCHLVFVGEYPETEFNKNFKDMLSSLESSGRVHITGFVTPDRYKLYLAATDCAIQLRKMSRGETSAAILDVMGSTVPTIINANGALAELPADCVILLPDVFSLAQLSAAMCELFADQPKREQIGRRAREHIQNSHSPRLIADQYRANIEGFCDFGLETIREKLVRAIASTAAPSHDNVEWLELASAAEQNLARARAQKQLFVDISILASQDAKTGIQRVVRSVLLALMQSPPIGYRIEPVYGDISRNNYYYARKFTLKFINCPSDCLEDAPLEFAPGDIFLGLDLAHANVLEMAAFFDELRNIGVRSYFVIYDLLPIIMPDYFPSGISAIHTNWLSSLGSRVDGLICISRAVADELLVWLNANIPRRSRPLQISWFHLGSDLESSSPTQGLPNDWQKTLDCLGARPNFLSVGTIEPRKGQSQTLEAFEILWQAGFDVNFAVVGRQGWHVEGLIEKIRNHRELGKRLFWLEGISDAFLEKVYAASTCLIAASEGEGFGLPLIEAAKHGIALLARDIPVFREVAREHAIYFCGLSGKDLALAIEKWLALTKEGNIPNSTLIEHLTWKESVAKLKQIIAGETSYLSWRNER
jgi:glycosyltransferase involved in cell wall biosynthesis